jgi:hypothetical protein
MPITVVEKPEDREFTVGEEQSSANTGVKKFLVTGTDEDSEAAAALHDQAPEQVGDGYKQTSRVEWLSPGRWLGYVNYGPKAPTPVGEFAFSFDTTGATQHVTQSIQTVGRYAPPGKTAPDFKGAVGVTADNVEGVDIVTPAFNFTLRVKLPIASWNPTYVANMRALTGKVNSTGFYVRIHGATYTFPAGELLFLGGSGDESTASEFIELTLRFAASPNRTGITIGDISGIDKKGWEYLWVRYEDVEDAGAKMIVKRPAAVCVEKVYEEGNFGLLGISIPPP